MLNILLLCCRQQIILKICHPFWFAYNKLKQSFEKFWPKSLRIWAWIFFFLYNHFFQQFGKGPSISEAHQHFCFTSDTAWQCNLIEYLYKLCKSLLLFPFCRWESRSPERLRNLPKFPKWRSRYATRVCQVPKGGNQELGSISFAWTCCKKVTSSHILYKIFWFRGSVCQRRELSKYAYLLDS